MVNAAQPDSLVGQVLDGRYQLVQRIGEGGMGVVYKAQQLATGHVVAVKVLNAHMARDPTWVQRFYNEAQATSQLQHPNTIRMHEFGQTPGGVLYLSMEFLDGQSLREAIAKSAPMPPMRVLHILNQCCASLSEAHNLGIIHRDIKPDNIFLLTLQGANDYVKVLDFSVAKLLQNHGFRTQAGMVFGTPEYMSPEQGRGRQLDARSDVYALGAIAFEMLTGRVPFSDPHNPMAILQAHMTLPVPALPQTVPPPLAELVKRCMAKEPGQRYGSSEEMRQHADQIRAHLGGGPAPTFGNRGAAIPTPNPGRGGPPAQKTMVAGGPPGGAPPAGGPPVQKTMVAGNQPPVGRPPAAAKTMMADASALGVGRGNAPPPAGPPPAAPPQERTIPAQRQGAHGGPPPAGAPHAGAPHGGAASAGGKPSSAVAKTMMAGNAAELFGAAGPPALGGGPPSMPPAGSMGQPPAMPAGGGGAPQSQGGGPPKTMMLQPSDGVVSFNMGGQVQAHPSTGHDLPPPAPAVRGGASVGFWLFCLIVGAGVGVGAYFVFLTVSNG